MRGSGAVKGWSKCSHLPRTGYQKACSGEREVSSSHRCQHYTSLILLLFLLSGEREWCHMAASLSNLPLYWVAGREEQLTCRFVKCRAHKSSTLHSQDFVAHTRANKSLPNFCFSPCLKGREKMKGTKAWWGRGGTPTKSIIKFRQVISSAQGCLR